MLPFTELDKARLYLLFKLSSFAPASHVPPPAPVLRVIIIRHGEKPEEGDNLSCTGLNRALALPAVLHRLLPTPPAATYVPIIGTKDDSTSTARMFQTVMPYAVQYNLCVNSNYAVENAAGLAKELRHQRGAALVVWEHNAIPEIAKHLGIKEEMEWPDDDFDSIWTIEFSGGGAKGKAKHPTLTKSRQGLHPSATCPGQ